ncbi:MAG TPA: 16S rRNA (cytidine(1402)-2'-O)-methyltransferase [Gemmatimonadaceae bacterium]|nr:16S rRNA (cytidine(1402)-2'-O)-methyltransferase [Gemmatimonadaceae bacterium]
MHVVSTPIGNLGDMTFRAVEVLGRVALILAEDTRHSRPLLAHFEIGTPVEAYHEHNEARMTPRVLARLRAGDDVALISDAGTPLLSDPGARLVAAALDAGLAVVPVPGASALLSALVAAGLGADRFTFYGFPPRRGGERTRLLAEIAALPHTAVLYEAPTRLGGTLADLARVAGEQRGAAVARELTKHYEEVRRGTLGELAAYYSATTARGEVVLLVAGAEPVALDEAGLAERARALRAEGRSARDVARMLMASFGAPRNLAYRLAQGDAGRVEAPTAAGAALPDEAEQG